MGESLVISASFSEEALLHELSVYSASVVRGSVLGAEEIVKEEILSWVIGEDDKELVRRFMHEFINSLKGVLGVYWLDDSGLTQEGGCRVSLSVSPRCGVLTERELCDRILYLAVMYVLYRWFAVQGVDRSLLFEVQYRESLRELKRLLLFRKGGILRVSNGW